MSETRDSYSLGKALFNRRFAELDKAHRATGGVTWQAADQGAEVRAIVAKAMGHGAVMRLVADELRPEDARFVELAHELVPHLLDEYRFLSAYYDRRQTETFTS